MIDITFIILTYNEEIHIRRALENVASIAKKVIVIDCNSTDKTREICAEYGFVETICHEWPGNQARQFNWALDNINFDSEWIFRLDADEYLTPELIEEVKEKLPLLSESVSAVVLPLGRSFLGKELKHEEINWMIRLFRNGRARYAETLMDEHLQVLSGQIIKFKYKFVDDNINTLSFFLTKHIKYADREALQALKSEYLGEGNNEQGDFCSEVIAVKDKKKRYYKLPMFWRAFLYFCIRYFVKLSILDGKEGFLWCFFQGWWYRTLVDAKILEIKKKCLFDKSLIVDYLIKTKV